MLTAALVAASAALAGPADGATLQPLGSYSSPMYVTSDPTDPDRLFIAERSGTVKLTTPSGTSTFLTIPVPVYTDGEQGLWSIAFPPDFGTTGLFYVVYSGGPSANNDSLVLDEYRASGDAADPGSRREVLAIPTPAGTAHNGGQLQFGPDGFLYWSIGEAGNSANAQDTANLFGKILRIDPRGSGGQPYSIPPDNPYVGVGGARPEIWSLGLRNPWRFSFDRLTGALIVADVGEGSLEEVDLVPQAAGGGRGANFGWPTCEGTAGTGCSSPPFTPPIFEYSHADPPLQPPSCSITGGYVVRDSGLDGLDGRYLFADLCGGDLRSIDPLAPQPLDGFRSENLSAAQPVSFGEDACGRLYLASFMPSPGQVNRVEGSSGGVCPPAPDQTAPDTALSLDPRNKRRSRVRATFTSTEPDSSFECRLDKRDWRACRSPRKLPLLHPGRHRFRARAIDAAGNVDPTPAKRRVRVKPRDPG